MKIPKEDVERERFIEEIISKCLFSREERARTTA